MEGALIELYQYDDPNSSYLFCNPEAVLWEF